MNPNRYRAIRGFEIGDRRFEPGEELAADLGLDLDRLVRLGLVGRGVEEIDPGERVREGEDLADWLERLVDADDVETLRLELERRGGSIGARAGARRIATEIADLARAATGSTNTDPADQTTEE